LGIRNEALTPIQSDAASSRWTCEALHPITPVSVASRPVHQSPPARRS
jgi:hypothetical protein